MQFASYANRRLGRWGGASVRRLTNHYLDLVGRASLAGLRVCEIGPGRGNFAEACRAADAIYLGVECCPDFVRQLRERRFAVVETEVPPIPRNGDPYDLIFAGGMMEHLAPERIAPFLRSALDALRPGGRLCLVAPDYLFMGRDFFLAHYTHCWPTTARTMRQAAADAGFAVVDVRLFSQWPWPRLSKLIPDWHERLTIARLSWARRIYLEAIKP